MAADTNATQEETAVYQELVKAQIPELFCDNCGFYPIEPVHGHFMCPSCDLKLETPTKCCEETPANV